MDNLVISHLFRHQFGKMVSILTNIFGFEHLTTIEDAIQDTFIQALKSWPNKMPDNPEAWLTAAAKNRVIDIFRSLNAQSERNNQFSNSFEKEEIDAYFLDEEISDSQLKMIFTACHPTLDAKDQIAFALKTISGFNTKEIAAALLSKEDSIKKRLQRARKSIISNQLKFEIPEGTDLHTRLTRVLEVIYVIFNEGFHSNKKDIIVRKELCGEALRLIKLILKNPNLRTSDSYALMALLCFHSARLESKVNELNELIPISKQDRSKWYFPLIAIGNDAMNKALEISPNHSAYHYEAAIVSEHLRAPTYEHTDWKSIAYWYEKLNEFNNNAHTSLNLAIVYLELGELEQAYMSLISIDENVLVDKAYLYHATMAKYYHLSQNKELSIHHIDIVLLSEISPAEKSFFEKNKLEYS